MTETRHALVVDDNQLNSKLVAAFLRKLGWDADTVDSGDLALQTLESNRYDMVLLDLRMPTMTGEQVCHSIRQRLGLSNLHVVAYTAHGMPEEKRRMLDAGFDDLLIKPISFADVKAVCEEFAASGRGASTGGGA